MWPKPQETAYLVTSAEDIFNIIFVEGCSFSKKKRSKLFLKNVFSWSQKNTGKYICLPPVFVKNKVKDKYGFYYKRIRSENLK